MSRHVFQFDHDRKDVEGPICAVCGTPIDFDKWWNGDDCPGSPDDQLAKSAAMLMSVLKP